MEDVTIKDSQKEKILKIKIEIKNSMEELEDKIEEILPKKRSKVQKKQSKKLVKNKSSKGFKSIFPELKKYEFAKSSLPASRHMMMK